MYCANCRCELHYEDPAHHGYCESCGNIVGVSHCKVSYWCIAGVIAILWMAPFTS